MMRAALILVGLGTLVAMELEAPPRTAKAVIEPKSQSTVGISHSRDTLTKADRLEIHDVQHQAPARPTFICRSNAGDKFNGYHRQKGRCHAS